MSTANEGKPLFLGASELHWVPVSLILPNEDHDPRQAELLAEAIEREQLWRFPVTLERESGAIMDGHHRTRAANLLGLSRVPCLLLDYMQVQVFPRRSDWKVTPDEIVRRSKAGDLYPQKTTRHQFPSPLPLSNVSLSLLKPKGIGPRVPVGE